MGSKVCLKYSITANAYPRYAYFQKRLASVVPRFVNILDSANLWSCISEGHVKLQEIKSAAKHVTDWVKVIVVGNVTEELERLESEIAVRQHEKIKAKKELVTWVGAKAELITRFDPCFIVYLVDNPTPEMIRDLKSQFSSLSPSQLYNIIIYDSGTGQSCLYLDLLNSTGLPPGAKGVSLSQLVQYELEARAVEVLEMVAVYVTSLAPRPSIAPDRSLLDECSTSVTESLGNQHVVDDLDPDNARPVDGDGTETEMDSSSPGSSMETDGVTTITSKPLDKQAIFVDNLMEFLIKKTKSIVCDHLSKKYGIPASVVNEFMNEAYYGYEERYKTACSNLSPPRWSDMRSGRQASLTSYSYVVRQSSFFHGAETYMKEKMEVLHVLGRLAFELHALLRTAVVPVSVALPTYPRLDTDLQDTLLDLAEVHGCGIVYGKLTLHVRQELTPSALQTVKDILESFRYSQPFVVELVGDVRSQADGTPVTVEIGNQLQATLTDEVFSKLKQENDNKVPKLPTTKEKCGSLGCFVKLSKVTGDGEAARAGQGDLYCVTCAHCVTGCHRSVKVKVGRRLHDFGEADCLIDDGERLDIAVIKVIPDQVKQCETCICPFNRDWWLYEGGTGDSDLIGRAVRKRGFVTGETTGIVTCNDYRMKKMEASNHGTGTNFDPVFNILIDVEPGSPQGTEFSKGGDSGSAVFYEWNSRDGLTTRILVVSLVQGSMTNKNKYVCTYTCHMKLGLEELCRNNGYRLVFPGPVPSVST